MACPGFFQIGMGRMERHSWMGPPTYYLTKFHPQPHGNEKEGKAQKSQANAIVTKTWTGFLVNSRLRFALPSWYSYIYLYLQEAVNNLKAQPFVSEKLKWKQTIIPTPAHVYGKKSATPWILAFSGKALPQVYICALTFFFSLRSGFGSFRTIQFL